MKKITVLLIITCMLLSGCGVRMSMADKDVNIVSSAGLFNQHSSYFDRYSAEKDETTCKVKGILHQAANDRNGIITYVTAQDGIGALTVTGNMNCTKGSLQLVYMSQDGTETLIYDGTERKIDAQIDVTEGEGSICFIGNGESSVCEFDIKMEAGSGVTFDSIMEEVESIEDFGLDEIEDNWPESIRYSSDGVYADPMSVNFDENDPKGTYTVDIDKKGTYQVLIYAKYHKGSVEITPMAE